MSTHAWSAPTSNYSLALALDRFLGPRGPLVLPLVDPPAPARAMKIWTPIYRHICLMNHQETPQTNPLAIWDPLDVSLNPLGPPAPPITPLGPQKRSLGLIEL